MSFRTVLVTGGVGGGISSVVAGAAIDVDASDPANPVVSVEAAVFDLSGTAAAEVGLHELAADPHTGYQKESEKNAANGYAGLSAGTKIDGAQQTYGTVANTACEGNDARLSDSRTPTAHTHSLAEITGDGTLAAVDDAPSDGTTYGRLNGAWAAAGGGSGLTHPQVMARGVFGGPF